MEEKITDKIDENKKRNHKERKNLRPIMISLVLSLSSEEK
jgi:hypothetical protein